MVTACLLVGWVRTMVPNVWRYGDPDVWRADGKTSATDPYFQPDMIMVTPSYCLNLIEEWSGSWAVMPAVARCGLEYLV